MVLWCFLGAMTLHAKQPEMNPVKKVYFHQGTVTDDLVLYYPKSPLINHIPPSQLEVQTTQNNKEETYTFLMPLTAMTQQQLNMINGYSDPQGLYSIKLKQIEMPIKGYQCVIRMNKEKIGLHVEVYNAITGDNAITFKLVKRDSLYNINHKSHPIINTAYAPLMVKKNFILS